MPIFRVSIKNLPSETHFYPKLYDQRLGARMEMHNVIMLFVLPLVPPFGDFQSFYLVSFRNI